MTEYILLSEEQARAIVNHALDGIPQEVCGLLVGNYPHIRGIIPVRNKADDPINHFEMDNVELAMILPELVDSELGLLGFYHSHPDGQPVLSPDDIQEAWPGMIYLIVSLKFKNPAFAAWKVDGQRVLSMKVHSGDELPAHPVNTITFDRRHKVAIIIGAIITLLIMIVLSTSLLPAAPRIP